MLFKANY